MHSSNTDYYDRIVSLLGKPVTDSQVVEFFLKLGQPDVSSDTPVYRLLTFNKRGLYLFLSLDEKTLCGAGFHFRSAPVESGILSVYGGSLYNGIRGQDTALDVSAKMNFMQPITAKFCSGQTIESSDYLEVYEIQGIRNVSLRLRFYFDSTKSFLKFAGLEHHTHPLFRK